MQHDLPKPHYRAWVNRPAKWEVYFPKTARQKAQRRFFLTEEAANKAVEQWAEGRAPAANVGTRKLDLFLQAEALLPEGVTVLDAVRFYALHHTGAKATTIQTAVDACRTDLKATSEAYRKEAKRWFDAVVAELGKDTCISSITAERWKAFVKNDTTSYWNRYARRRCASVVISKAMELGALKANPLVGFKLPNRVGQRPFFMSVEDTQVFMDHVWINHHELVPAFALQLFAGIRTEELSRKTTKDARGNVTKRALDWSDIAFEKRIDVGPETAKMHERGVIDFWPKALTNCLAEFQKDSGPICPYSTLKQIKSRIVRELNIERVAAKLPPIKFKQNAFRHSYGTYVCAQFQDPGRASLYLRQRDPDVLFTNYRDYAEQKTAVAFFSYSPPAKPLAEAA